MILFLQQGLLSDGIAVPLTKLCAWFGVPRRTVYYTPVKSPPKIDPAIERPIKAIPFVAAAQRLPANRSISTTTRVRTRSFPVSS